MGSNHSTQRYTRRRSLVEGEFEFPEPSWDSYHDWEIYYIDVELEVLPPNTRHNIYVRLDSYTQEIIEDECPREVNLLSPETEDRKSCYDNGAEISTQRRSSRGDAVEEAKEFHDGRVSRCVLKRGVCFVDGEFSNEFSQYQKRSRDVFQQSEDGVLVSDGVSSLKRSNAEAETESESVPMSNDMFLQWEMSLEENHAPATALPNQDREVLKSWSTHTDCDSSVRLRHGSKTLGTPQDGRSGVVYQNCCEKHETCSAYRDGASTQVPHDLRRYFPQQQRLQDDEDNSSVTNVFTDSYERDDQDVLEALTKSYVPDTEDLSVKLKAVTTESCALQDAPRIMGGTPCNCAPVEENADVFEAFTQGRLRNGSRCSEANRVSDLFLGGLGTDVADLSEKDGSLFSRSECESDDNVFLSPTTADLQERNVSSSRARDEPAEAQNHQLEARVSSVPKPFPATSRVQRNRACSLSEVTTSWERDRTKRNVATSRKSRKYSLKAEPGWIPNPLDSDFSEDDDMNDSGVFSDAASSPVFTGRRGRSMSTVSTESSKPVNATGNPSTADPDSRTTTGVFAAHATPERLEINAVDTRASAGVHQSVTRLGAACTTSLPEERGTNDKEKPISAAHLARKRLTLQVGRRRHNSEPTPVTPGSDEKNDEEGRGLLPQVDASASRPSSLSDDRADRSRWQSKWRLVRLLWGRKRKAKQPEEAPAMSAPCRDDLKAAEEEDEVDLDEQLAWMTRPTYSENASQVGTEPPSPSDADPDAIDFGNATTPGNRSHATASSSFSSSSDPRTKKEVAPSSYDFTLDDYQRLNYQPSLGRSGDARSSQKPPAVEPELELDWLCEPEWNNFELELFWSVLRPHMEKLLASGEEGGLLEPCVAVRSMDAGDHKMLDRCLLHVQCHIWKGNYRQAVADFRAVRRHFRCCAESHLIESETRDDVESLRLVFQRKRPSRFRFWI